MKPWRKSSRTIRMDRPQRAVLPLRAATGLAICALLGAAVAAIFGGTLTGTARAGALDPAYQASIEKWRQAYEATLRSDDGWLTVTGLFWLHEGDNRFGSDPANDIVIAGKNVPAQIGLFTMHQGKVFAHARPGVALLLNGKPMDTAELHADATDERLQLGDLSFFLHASGTRLGIRLRDKNSKARREFSGLHWFPIDPSYRLTARYVPYPAPKDTPTQNIVGDFDNYAMTGNLEFTLQGKPYKLEVSEYVPGSRTLFVVFRDLTSSKQTDSAARFIVTDPPKNGLVELDFNKAYNPPCAYTAYATCPLPSPGNRMHVAILAGEKNYKDTD